MAAGNTFVLKSSEKSPISIAQYGALIQRAGFHVRTKVFPAAMAGAIFHADST
jgi:acyl-CoA reductase-like NAD-dependent aldehyde dehydrogenase